MESEQKKGTSQKSKFNFRKFFGFLGAVMIFFPEHVSNVWGTMNVYLTSYFYIKHGIIGSDAPGKLAAFYTGLTIGVSIAGYLTFLGRKRMIFFGIIVFNVGILSIYFMAYNGFTILLFVAFGALGFSSGIVDALVYKILTEIGGSSKGRCMSMALSGYNFGSFFINLFIGTYINPNNVAPDLNVEGMSLFSCEEMLERVPTLFLILGIAYFICMFTGFCLLCLSISKPERPKKDHSIYKSFSEGEERMRQPIKTCNHNVQNNAKPEIENIKERESGTNLSTFTTDNDDNGCNNNKEKDLSPYQTLKSPSFYVLVYSNSACLFMFLLVNNSYKIFGLLYIKDDHLLTILGSALSLASGFSRMAWGLFLDRFSIKKCLVILFAYQSFTILLMYFSVFVNRYLYFIVTLLAIFGTNAILPSFVIATLDFFGDKHYNKNYGMLYATRLPACLGIPIIFDKIQGAYGWFGNFCCSCCLTMASLILTCLVVPDIAPNKKGW